MTQDTRVAHISPVSASGLLATDPLAHLLAGNASSIADVALHRRREVIALRCDLANGLVDLAGDVLCDRLRVLCNNCGARLDRVGGLVCSLLQMRSNLRQF